MTKTGLDDFTRFIAKYVVDPSGCWLWIAAINKYGYGHFMLRNPKRMVRAHRFSYTLYKSKIPRNKLVLHTCDVRHCVNPAHLVVGTQTDNMQQAIERGRFCEGARHHATKLTTAQVRKIRADSRTTKVIAKTYGISKNYVSDIRNYRERTRVI